MQDCGLLSPIHEVMTHSQFDSWGGADGIGFGLGGGVAWGHGEKDLKSQQASNTAIHGLYNACTVVSYEGLATDWHIVSTSDITSLPGLLGFIAPVQTIL